MNASRLPLLISLAGAAILFAAIAFVLGMVVLSLFTGEALQFGGEHSSEALAVVLGVAA